MQREGPSSHPSGRSPDVDSRPVSDWRHEKDRNKRYDGFMSELTNYPSDDKSFSILHEVGLAEERIRDRMSQLPVLTCEFRVKQQYVSVFDLLEWEHPGILEFFKSDPTVFDYTKIQTFCRLNSEERALFYNDFAHRIISMLRVKLSTPRNLTTFYDLRQLIETVYEITKEEETTVMHEVLEAYDNFFNAPSLKVPYRDLMKARHDALEEVLLASELHKLMRAFMCRKMLLFPQYMEASRQGKGRVVAEIIAEAFVSEHPDRKCHLQGAIWLNGVNANYTWESLSKRLDEDEELGKIFPKRPVSLKESN